MRSVRVINHPKCSNIGAKASCGRCFLGVVKTPDLSTFMEDFHLDVVGMTIDERMARRRDGYKGEEVNYSQYEAPSYERIKV